MPELYDFIVDKRRIHAINFCTPEITCMLQEAGLGSVPCDNPACDGEGGGRWDTVPYKWSYETADPDINLDEMGMPAPEVCMRSRCVKCNKIFRHTDAVTLARLRDVPALRADLPFDPEWRFGDVKLACVFTSACETDIVTRQGMSTLLQKVERLGAQTTQAIVERYLAAGQLAYDQLQRTVGDAAWQSYPPMLQLQLAVLRGEYVALESIEDRVMPLGVSGGQHDAACFGLPTLNANSFTTSILEVFERRRKLRERQQCAVGCEEVCSLDFCAHSGKLLGGKWQLLVTNEENNLIGSLVTDTVKLEDVAPFMSQLRKRPNFSAKVAVIDNVPPSIDLSLLSKLEKLIMDTLHVEWVGQDRFHVAHSFSPKFNNTSPEFFPLIILGWRHATVERDRQCERLVDEKLLNGEMSKACTFRDVKYQVCGVEWRKGNGEWQSVEEDAIAEWKEIGLYHQLFSTSPNVIVPENVLEPEALVRSIDRYAYTTLHSRQVLPDNAATHAAFALLCTYRDE